MRMATCFSARPTSFRGGRAGVGQISRAVDHAMPLNWRLHDLTITLVDRLPREGS